MSMQAINYAMTLPVDEPGPRLLLFVIAHHVHWKTGTMHVGQSELAEEVRSSERSVRRWLVYLEQAGFITRKECRDEKGHRLFDEIELLGYLEWQDVLYNGGTLPHPSTRGKPVEQPADNLAGGEEAYRTNEDALPDKSGQPTGQLCPPHIEPLRTIRNHNARGGAREGNPDLEDADQRKRSRRKPTKIYPGTKEWAAWRLHYEQRGVPANMLAKVCELGVMEVPDRYPPMEAA